MKSISKILAYVKNLIPYLLLIGIYFFLVNLEAGKDKKNNRTSENEYILTEEELNQQNKQQRIKIPVIPYKQ